MICICHVFHTYCSASCFTCFECFRGNFYDHTLVHAVETVIIDWIHQIQDVLKRDSAQPLLEGLNPVPSVEIKFWENRAQNLECIYEQVKHLVLPNINC